MNILAAKIEDGVVTNIIVIGDPNGVQWAIDRIGGTWVPGEGAKIGDTYVDGIFVSPPFEELP